MKKVLVIIAIKSLFLFNLYSSENKTNESVPVKNSNFNENEQFMLEMLGYMTVYRDGLKELGFGAEEAELISRGFKKALEDEEMDISYQYKMEEFQAFIEKRISKTQLIREQEKLSQVEDNIKSGNDFLEGLKLDKSVKTTPSGLYYKILEKGNNKFAKVSDTVRVHYKGTRIDGTKFDSSYDRGKPADFSLQGVVPGFSEGLTKIGEGGKIMLFIPSDLAYGNNPRRGGVIQPGDTLIFECELIKINP